MLQRVLLLEWHQQQLQSRCRPLARQILPASAAGGRPPALDSSQQPAANAEGGVLPEALVSDEPPAGGSPPSADGAAAVDGPRAAAVQHAGATHQPAMPPAADPISQSQRPAVPIDGSAAEVSSGDLSQGDVEKLLGLKAAEELAWWPSGCPWKDPHKMDRTLRWKVFSAVVRAMNDDERVMFHAKMAIAVAHDLHDILRVEAVVHHARHSDAIEAAAHRATEATQQPTGGLARCNACSFIEA